MSILQKQKEADPSLGYARDFPPLIARIAKRILDRKITVIANAGGVNPLACAQEIRRLAPDLRVAVVLGDDLYGSLDSLLSRGIAMRNMDTGEPLSSIRTSILSANAYIGAFPLVDALATGADVVVAGRCTDTALALAPMIHRFGWKRDQYDLLAAGTIAGHIVECGAQCTGGNSQVDWQVLPDMANVGYPIIEADPDGTFVITKHPGTGGRISSALIKEQLLYELGDPKSYITPDCIADFTSVRLKDEAADRVRVTGITGGASTGSLKVSVSYLHGYKAIGSLVYSWPDAIEKARAADRIVRERLSALDLHFDEVYSEYLGYNACHGPTAVPPPEPSEVQLRIGVRSPNKKEVDRFTRELIPLVLSGPPTATGFGDGRPPVREVVAYWPALIPGTEVSTRVEVLG